ncbi:NUDIX domain-containing protein [Colletotrichum navitas]|uniref:NUDIX domain-containing protein n=1 Tax=Colletotrichum navitas TaxID=681940 RepID=A0AAD8V7T7_9PEZI|nr:NUDIX domain-containing protein [Colletotrichum navitas]KAK1597482.1 NUDIX domain-containing protein [Colletotrichum navitas]
MAASNFVQSQYPSEAFVESCGAIAFDLSKGPAEVCLLRYLATDEWLLAKGRRNCDESRHKAALRDVLEETGFRCRLLPVDMATRAPGPDDDTDATDAATARRAITEPFMLTTRSLDGGAGVKLIWWNVAAVKSDNVAREGTKGGGTQFEARFFSCDEAVEKLTFESDREVLRRAIDLIKKATF